MPASHVPSLRDATHHLGRLLSLIEPYWPALARSAAMALVLGLLGLVPPFLTKLLIDLVYPTGNADLLHVLVAAGLSFTLAGAILGGLRGFYTLYVDSRLTSAIRLVFFNHLQHLPPRFFHQHQVGEINSRFQDVALALRTLSELFRTVFVQGTFLLLVPPLLFWLEWRLALLALASVPLVTGLTAFSGRFLRPRWQRASEALAEINAFQIETLSHVETFKAMGLERRTLGRAQSLIETALEHQLRARGLSELFNSANTAVKALNLAIFSWLAWLLILDGKMTLGEYVAFTSYVNLLYGPVAQLLQFFGQFQQSAVHLGRMFEYLDSPPEQDPSAVWEPAPPPGERLAGKYRLAGVSFAYVGGRPVFADFDLELPAGTLTAVVGPSGSGKTTLLRLLSSLERPTAGHVLVDGQPLDQVGLGELRRQITAVWQDPALVRGSLWDNLVLGAAGEPTTADVDRAVDLCGLTDVVGELAAGYETPVAEWGATLSAGQRQRVALARAVLRDSPIVLFDEATSHLDASTENAVLDRLLAHLDGRTVIFVTHRLALAERAERILVLDRGEVAGFASHAALLETCGPYRRLYDADRTPARSKP